MSRRHSSRGGRRRPPPKKHIVDRLFPPWMVLGIPLWLFLLAVFLLVKDTLG